MNMGDDWKKAFPSAGVAEMVVQRLQSISVRIENGDVIEAQKSLRGWEQHLDFTGVPSSVRHDTDLILNTALSFLKGTPPDTDLALGQLEKARRLWR